MKVAVKDQDEDSNATTTDEDIEESHTNSTEMLDTDIPKLGFASSVPPQAPSKGNFDVEDDADDEESSEETRPPATPGSSVVLNGPGGGLTFFAPHSPSIQEEPINFHEESDYEESSDV